MADEKKPSKGERRYSKPAKIAPKGDTSETQEGNKADMVRHGTRRYGADTPRAKLDPDKVRVIRKLAGEGLTQRAIAKMFGVTQTSIFYVIRGKSWAHLE